MVEKQKWKHMRRFFGMEGKKRTKNHYYGFLCFENCNWVAGVEEISVIIMQRRRNMFRADRVKSIVCYVVVDAWVAFAAVQSCLGDPRHTR